MSEETKDWKPSHRGEAWLIDGLEWSIQKVRVLIASEHVSQIELVVRSFGGKGKRADEIERRVIANSMLHETREAAMEWFLKRFDVYELGSLVHDGGKFLEGEHEKIREEYASVK